MPISMVCFISKLNDNLLNNFKSNTFMRTRILHILLFMLCAFGMSAQVTTSSMRGKVVDKNGEELIGATVIAVHTPSGTQYSTSTNTVGRFILNGMRVGGPYTVSVSYIGYEDYVHNNIFLSLGVASDVNTSLKEGAFQLDELVISDSKNNLFSGDRAGAAVTFGNDALLAIPNLGRTIDDVSRYNVYSNGRGSFAGQDARLSSFTIDGSVFNNGFGLGNSAAAGGRTGTTAISFDALEEVQYNITPYDVKQSGFAGAGINAVTRSGTNDLSASIYYFTRNNDLTGKKADGKELAPFTINENTYGARVGGAIIKNKLFYFANFEYFKSSNPALNWNLNRGTGQGNESRVLESDMIDLANFMKTNFNFDLGRLDGFNNDVTSLKGLVRLDYNLDNKNKISVRYSHHNSESGQRISDSNSSNLAGFGNRTNRSLAISPENTGYIILDNTRSVALELNSLISNSLSNNLVLGFNKQIEDRKYRAQLFPTIDILKDGSTYTSIGFDPFTPNNQLNYSTFNLTNNLTKYVGKHQITLGGTFEYFVSNNLFFPTSNGVYTYNSIDDFKTAALQFLNDPDNPVSPVTLRRYNLRYSLLPNGVEPWQTLKTSTYALYLQDEVDVTDRLKVTLGLRGDIQVYDNSTAKDFFNPVVARLTYKDEDGKDLVINTSQFPKPAFYVSPRFGFNYDLTGDRKTQIRGGSGIFVSRIPQVLVSNMLGNNGVNTTTIRQDNTTAFPFTTDPSRFIPANVDLESLSGYVINASKEDLRFPTIWKSSLAIDQQLGNGFSLTVEGIYNKNIHALRYIDANLKNPDRKFSGPDQRERFPSPRFINDRTQSAFILSNTNVGKSYTFTTKLEKAPSKEGIGGMLGYTYGYASNLQSVASTVLANIPTVTNQNSLLEAIADQNLRHRIVGFVNYVINYGNTYGGKTLLTLGLESSGGSPLTYSISGDLNGDGQNNDLIYVPNNGSELSFAQFTSGGKTFTPAQQQEAFEAFISNSSYFNSRRGKYTERNGAEFPWYTRINAAITQDINVKVGGKKNALQLRLDVTNLGNMINNKWGVGYTTTTSQPLALASVSGEGVPVYRLATQTINGQTELLRDDFVKAININNVWQAQLGVRYTFN